jgi:hypothetical protein
MKRMGSKVNNVNAVSSMKVSVPSAALDVGSPKNSKNS